jgi:hypothetical protein
LFKRLEEIIESIKQAEPPQPALFFAFFLGYNKNLNQILSVFTGIKHARIAD